jgi:hypothetical protein
LVVGACGSTAAGRSGDRRLIAGNTSSAGRVVEAEVGDPAVAVAGDGAGDLRLRGAGAVAGAELPRKWGRGLRRVRGRVSAGVLEAAARRAADETFDRAVAA